MWLPDRLYESLPALYGLGGLVTFYNFENPVGYVSGFMLLLTACIIWLMRRDYRQGRNSRKN